MLADWSAECTAEDPVLVVPWKAPDSSAAFVDLRANPYDFEAIPEAEQYPPLMRALCALNAARSPFFTAKCDAWLLEQQEFENLKLNLDPAPGEESPQLGFGFASYIDLVARADALFSSFARQEQMLRKLTRLAARLDHPHAVLDCVLRPALDDLECPRQGFALSLYVKALGADLQAAVDAWSAALSAVITLVRSKDLTR